MNELSCRSWRLLVATLLLAVAAFATVTATPRLAHASSHEATPATTYSCDMFADQDATPDTMAGMDHGDMDHGDMDMADMPEFDQVYIDMMIPHHASIIAMSQAALPLLTDERLIAIAENVITTQEAEIAVLRDLRERIYGDPNPDPMDAEMMALMDEMMPEAHMVMMDGVDMMDSDALVAAFCASDDYDLAFIDLTIPHHEGAVLASEDALDQAVHDEIRDLAERVIADQEAEIAVLIEIREDLTGEATPADMSAPADDDHDHDHDHD